MIGEFDLELPEYQYFKGVNDFSTDVRFFGQARTSGKILNIKMVESYLLVAYFPGFSGEDTEESFIPRSPEEARRFWEGVRQKYPHRMAVFDSSGHLISDFVLEGLLPTSMVIRNGELWMLEQPDEEVGPDYFRLFRVGLKEELRNLPVIISNHNVV